MNNKNSGRKCHEDEYENIKNKDYNFDFDFEFDIDESDECSINGMGNIDNEDCKEVYQQGFKDGYEKAKQEVLDYMKKNKCCIKCKHKCKSKSSNKNKCFMKCKHGCKLRGTNINKNFRKMIKCM